MERKCINIVAKNYPEVIEILNKKFNVSNILNKERKFLHFEGVNFVYKYKMIIVVRKELPMCEICGYTIGSKISWWQCKKVCSFCYKTKTKGYHG